MSLLAEAVQNFGERVVANSLDHNLAMHLGVYDYVKTAIINKSVLDVGSGSGYGSELFATSGAKRVVGVEYSQAAVEYSVTNHKVKNLSFIEGNFNEKISLAERFDIVFSSNVFEHLISIDIALNNVHQHMKPDGKFYLEIPAIHEHQRLISEIKNPFHYANLTIKMWNSILCAAFKKVNVYAQAINSSSEFFNSLSKDDKARKMTTFSNFVEIDGSREFGDKSEITFLYANALFVCEDQIENFVMPSLAQCPVSSIRSMAWRSDPISGWTDPLNDGDSFKQYLPVSGWIGGIELFLGDCDQRGFGIIALQLCLIENEQITQIKYTTINLEDFDRSKISVRHWMFYREPMFISDSCALQLTINAHLNDGSVFNIALGSGGDLEPPILARVFHAIAPLPHH